jgi:hypothetical protein
LGDVRKSPEGNSGDGKKSLNGDSITSLDGSWDACSAGGGGISTESSLADGIVFGALEEVSVGVLDSIFR